MGSVSVQAVSSLRLPLRTGDLPPALFRIMFGIWRLVAGFLRNHLPNAIGTIW